MKQYLYKIAQSNALRDYLSIQVAISAFGFTTGCLSGSGYGLVNYATQNQPTQLKDIPPIIIKGGLYGFTYCSTLLWAPPVLTGYAISEGINSYKYNKVQNEYLKAYDLTNKRYEKALKKSKPLEKNYDLALSEVRKAEKILKGNINSIEFKKNAINAQKVFEENRIISTAAKIEVWDLYRERELIDSKIKPR